MKMATWIYRILWLVVIGYLGYVLPLWEAVGAIVLIGGLVFLKSVKTYGEVLPHVDHLRTLAGQMVAASQRELKEMRDKLEQHGLT